MKLSVETITAHQDLLLTSLPDRLAPRWQLLSSIANVHAVKAEDHLTALATLSDQEFSQTFGADYMVSCIWQSTRLLLYTLSLLMLNSIDITQTTPVETQAPF